MWFDNFGLKRFLELHGPEGEASLDIELDGNIKVDHSKKRNGPLNEEQSDYGIVPLLIRIGRVTVKDDLVQGIHQVVG